MINWWESLTVLQQFFAMFGIIGTIIMVLQMIMLLFGLGDNDGDIDCDFDTDIDLDVADDVPDFDAPDDGLFDSGMRVFAVRGIVAFFSVAGWLGVVLLGTEMNAVLSCFIAVAGGLLATFLTAYAMRASMKLQQNGMLRLENAIGLRAQVYIPIPPKGKGTGKIYVVLQERYSELDACTDSTYTLPSNSWVVVRDVIGNATLLVEPE